MFKAIGSKGWKWKEEERKQGKKEEKKTSRNVSGHPNAINRRGKRWRKKEEEDGGNIALVGTWKFLFLISFLLLLPGWQCCFSIAIFGYKWLHLGLVR